MSLEDARASLERGDFARALEQVGPADGTEPALELRSAAAYGAGDLELAVTALEDLHALHQAAGRPEEAALAAARVAIMLLCETGLLAPVRGWVARAERLVADLPVGPVSALLELAHACERVLCGDPDGAREPARAAVELGDRFDVDPARGIGRTMLARVVVHDGDVDGAIAILDELAVDLATGAFDPLTTGNVYCELICVAHWLGRADLAREWTDVMERWRHGHAFGAVHGRCRVHRAELLRVSGPGEEAEREAVAACTELSPWLRRELGWPLVELGNIRLRRGDLAGAEEAFRQAHERAWSPQPGLALLRLEQGDLEAATSMLTSEIEHPSDVPWKERPPFGDLRLVPLLDARATVSAAAGSSTIARATAERLRAIAARYPGPALDAVAALAGARAALLEGELADAMDRARVAVALWVELAAPYDAATARCVLAEALAAAGDDAGAAMEWLAAADAFAEFGAPVREAEARARSEGRPPRSARPAAVHATLVRRGSHWEIAFGGESTMLADLKGLGYLARLVAEPGRELHVLDLVGSGLEEQGIPVLDEEAKAAYRRRLADVEDDLAEADREHDEARRALAERDRDYLLAELSSAVGLSGRIRTTGATAERARGAVTRSLRYALARVGEAHPELGAHLSRAVRTGAFCSYRPDPVSPVEWRLR